MNFLWVVLFLGILVATFQDLKRREVDDWLNYLILFSGIVFISLGIIFTKKFSQFLLLGFAVLIGYILSEVMYYGRVFAGGDSKLLFAISPFFIANNFSTILVNFGVFIFLLLLVGSFYGLIYALVLFFINFKKSKKEISKSFKRYKGKYFVLLALFFFLMSFFGKLFFFIGIFILFFFILFIFAKAIEVSVMYKKVSGKNLREGDWLVKDILVRGKTIKADWNGLIKKDLVLLKNKKEVLIKEGIPFVPVFLIAFLSYNFIKGLVFSYLRNPWF